MYCRHRLEGAPYMEVVNRQQYKPTQLTANTHRSQVPGCSDKQACSLIRQAAAVTRDTTTHQEWKMFFIPFPKPVTKKEKYERCIGAWGRTPDELNTGKVISSTYIGSKHFVGKKVSTDIHPDSVPVPVCASLWMEGLPASHWLHNCQVWSRELTNKLSSFDFISIASFHATIYFPLSCSNKLLTLESQRTSTIYSFLVFLLIL